MALLLGTAPNQVPTNADLGTMAFQDQAAVNITGGVISAATLVSPVVSSGTANGVAYLNGSKVLTTGTALTFDGTNLGLGVTPSAWISSSKAIQINTKTTLAGDTSNGTILTDNLYLATGPLFKYLTTATGTVYQQTNGNHYWYNTPSGTAGTTASITQAMTLDASGNLGIGTTTPSASAILDAQSTTKGVRMPNMTTTQKNAIASPAAGLMVFDTTLAKLCVYSGSAWQTITSI